MFKELLPLLATRGLVLTVGMVKNDAIRVTITPRPKDKDEAKQVIQPFVVEGSAEELDTELPKAIETYAGEIMTLERSLEQLKTNTEAVLKEAKAEADKKIADAKAKNKTGAKPAVKPAIAKPEPPKAPEPPSLFDAPAQDSSEAQPTVPAATEVAAETPSDDSDDDPPNGPDGSDDDSDDSDESDDQSDEQPDQVNVAAIAPAVTPISQPSMFDQNRFDDEEEVLKEAFGGAENNLIAA
jgi:PRTRC genetic system protein E